MYTTTVKIAAVPASRSGGQKLGWTALVLLLALMTLGARSVSAYEYCVGTLDELNTALDSAADPNSALFKTTVKVQTGTYHVGSTRMTQSGQQFFYELELLGGYNSDCSARTINPDNTVFDADAADSFFFRPLGDLLIEAIRFQNIGGGHRVEVWSAANDVAAQ